MINVVCVQWGNKYSDDYVIKLYNSISRNTSHKINFNVYSDRDRKVPGQIRYLPKGVDSWYNKLQLFYLDKELLPYSSQVFYFDLDTIITGNIDHIFEYDGNFIALRDFYRADGLGSGLMSWHTYKHSYIWDYYKTVKNRKHGLGDQGIVEEATKKEVDRWQDLYPDEIVSYKVHCRRGLPKNAKIVCFHGRPNPPDLTESWAKEHWK